MKFQEWQELGGTWSVAAKVEEKYPKDRWWYPARMLGMELDEYVKFLKSYGASHFAFNGVTLVFAFDNYNDAHKLLLYLNRMARNNNW